MLGRLLGYTPADRLCLCVPLFHCFGCVIGVLGAYTHGACLCPIEFFDAHKVLETVHRERCTALYGVPTMFIAILDHPRINHYRLDSLRTGIMAGAPAFRKYDSSGQLLYERVIQGREIDPLVDAVPDRWPRRGNGELPFVTPTVRTAAIDRTGNLWVSFMIPLSYVDEPDGEKVRTVQFRGAGVITPASLWFAENGRILATPGCYEFAP